MGQTFELRAVYVETGSKGAVFRIQAETSGLATPEAIHGRHREAVGAIDDFCERYYTEPAEDDVADDKGIDPFCEWPFSEFELVMPYHYRGLGGDWSGMAVVIADRHLANHFWRAFCNSSRL